jgi:hypothetical protein
MVVNEGMLGRVDPLLMGYGSRRSLSKEELDDNEIRTSMCLAIV